MSRTLELITDDWKPTATITERFGSWGGESFPLDPRQFAYDGLQLTLHPTPDHVKELLPSPLRTTAESLVLDRTVLLEWSGGRLQVSIAEQLQQLFAEWSSRDHWAIAFESSSGEGSQTIRASGASIYSVLDECVARPSDVDLTLVLPPSL